MFFRYSQWTNESSTDIMRMEALKSLFSYLLVQTSGSVEDALEILRALAREYGIFDDNLTLEQLIAKLKEEGIIEELDGTLNITSKGVQQIRKDALKEVFSSLRKGGPGAHEMPMAGNGVNRLSETKKWQFGDMPTNIDLTQTLTNAFKRGGIDDFTLKEEDLEMYDSEHMTSCATVLMLDISHSMILYGEDRITPAKQVALALSELILTKYPKDYLALVVFGDEAKLMSLSELPFLQVGPYHTNTRAGLQLARNLLRRCGNVNKQIFMITDGKPSAIFDSYHRLYKNSIGLDPRIVNKTLDEAVACRRDKITISTFMVAQDPYLIDFVEELTKANKGRAYYSSLDHLGEFIFVDYMRNRRKKFGAE